MNIVFELIPIIITVFLIFKGNKIKEYLLNLSIENKLEKKFKNVYISKKPPTKARGRYTASSCLYFSDIFIKPLLFFMPRQLLNRAVPTAFFDFRLL